MSAVSANKLDPFVEFGKMVDVDVQRRYSKEEIQKAVNEAGPALVREMSRLYPNGVSGPDKHIPTWSDDNLRAITRHGKMKNAEGIEVEVSPEARAAAQKILDAGGSRVINPNADPWFSEDDMLNAYSHGVPDNSTIEEELKSSGIRVR